MLKELTVKTRVSLLQRKLYFKAKRDKSFRFYSLYDKISLPYVLRESYNRVKANGGSYGVDRISFDEIEKEGLENFLTKIESELKSRNYTPSPVKRVYIPKSNGKERPLGIPTIRDRVVQMATKIVTEPIFEAKFQNCSYGFRPRRSAADAISEIRKNLYHGYSRVLDVDLEKFFDTIPHNNLLYLLRKSIKDKSVIRLIRSWLKSPIVDKQGIHSNLKGTPQGGVISPLLANIYLDVLDRVILNLKLDIKMVRYADDFLLMSKARIENILPKLKDILSKMGLKLNHEKSKCINAYRESFCFLGFEFINLPSKFFGTKRKSYWNVRPSKQSEKKLNSKVRDYLKPRGHWDIPGMISGLNKILLGWLNYFSIPRVSYIWELVRKLKHFLAYRLFKWFRDKSQRGYRSYRQRTFDKLVANHRLLDIERYARLKHHATG